MPTYIITCVVLLLVQLGKQFKSSIVEVLLPIIIILILILSPPLTCPSLGEGGGLLFGVNMGHPGVRYDLGVRERRTMAG